MGVGPQLAESMKTRAKGHGLLQLNNELVEVEQRGESGQGNVHYNSYQG